MVSGVSKTTNWERSKTQSTLKRIDYLSMIHFSIPHPGFFFFLSWAVEVSWSWGREEKLQQWQYSRTFASLGWKWHMHYDTFCPCSGRVLCCCFVLFPSIVNTYPSHFCDCQREAGKQLCDCRALVEACQTKLSHKLGSAQKDRTKSPGRIKGTRKVEGTRVCLLVGWSWGVTWESQKEVKWEERTQSSL